jgi:hypothetical protein
MRRQGWRGFAVAGLLGLTGLALGCNERSKAEVREGARQAGQEVGKAAKDVEHAGKEAANASKEAAEGFREGWSGSGTDKTIGGNPAVIDNRQQPERR